MSWLSKALGISHSQNPGNVAQPYLQQIPDAGHRYNDPYIQQGQQSGQTLRDEYAKQLDPAAFIANIEKGYKPSDAYNFKKEELQKGMRAMGGAGGYGGSEFHQMQYGKEADDLLSGDMQQYLQNALGIYDKGIKGNENFYNKGYDAGQSQLDTEGGSLLAQGGAAATGQAQQNEQRQQLISSLLKFLSQSGIKIPGLS